MWKYVPIFVSIAHPVCSVLAVTSMWSHGLVRTYRYISFSHLPIRYVGLGYVHVLIAHPVRTAFTSLPTWNYINCRVLMWCVCWNRFEFRCGNELVFNIFNFLFYFLRMEIFISLFNMKYFWPQWNTKFVDFTRYY